MQFALWCNLSSRSSYPVLVPLHYNLWLRAAGYPSSVLSALCVKVEFNMGLDNNDDDVS